MHNATRRRYDRQRGHDNDKVRGIIDLFSIKNVKVVNIGPFFWIEKVVILDFRCVSGLEKANKAVSVDRKGI